MLPRVRGGGTDGCRGILEREECHGIRRAEVTKKKPPIQDVNSEVYSNCGFAYGMKWLWTFAYDSD